MVVFKISHLLFLQSQTYQSHNPRTNTRFDVPVLELLDQLGDALQLHVAGHHGADAHTLVALVQLSVHQTLQNNLSQMC